MRRKIKRGETILLKGWALFGEVGGGHVRRWSLVAFAGLCVLLVLRLTRRSRVALYGMLARATKAAAADTKPEIFARPPSSYASQEPFTAASRTRAASRAFARQLRLLLLDEHARAAIIVNLFNHAALTILLYLLAWAWRAG